MSQTYVQSSPKKAYLGRRGQIMLLVTNSLSIELIDDGRARFFIPLRIINVLNGETVASEETSRQMRAVLEDHLRQDNDLYLAKFFDLTSLWKAAVLMANFYLDWVKDDVPLIHNFRVLLRGKGLWQP